VQFGKFSDKKYAYKCKYPVNVNDCVVVDSPHDGYTCVSVKSVTKDDGTSKATKHVVLVVDDSDYKRSIEIEKSKKEIMSNLKQLAEEHGKLEFYRILAKTNPEIKNLLTKLESIGE
jgi:hypothetical protein